MLPMVYLFARAYKENKLRVNRGLFAVGAIFFLTVAITWISWFFQVYVFCRGDLKLLITGLNWGGQMFSIQTLMLIGILYYRLYSIFNETPMALSKVMNIAFSIYYLLMSIFLIFGLGVWANYFANSSLILAICGLLVVAAIVFLQFMFSYKLYRVHKSVGRHGHEQGMKAIIVKNTLLAVISTSVTLLLFVMIALDPIVNSVHFMFFRSTCAALDLYTNYFCILLSYSYFDAYYVKLCGCCDRGCHRMWSKCLVRKESKHEEPNDEEMQRVVSAEESTLTTTGTGTGTAADMSTVTGTGSTGTKLPSSVELHSSMNVTSTEPPSGVAQDED